VMTTHDVTSLYDGINSVVVTASYFGGSLLPLLLLSSPCLCLRLRSIALIKQSVIASTLAR